MLYSIFSEHFFINHTYSACYEKQMMFRNVSKNHNETFLFAYFEKKLYLCAKFAK